MADKTNHDDDGSLAFSAYLDYNRALRAWFVAWGVGGLALFLANNNAAKQLAGKHQLRIVFELLLLGALLQVLCAVINKTINWHEYISKTHKDAVNTWCCWLCERLGRCYCIDLGIDIATIVVFGWAAWKVVIAFT